MWILYLSIIIEYWQKYSWYLVGTDPERQLAEIDTDYTKELWINATIHVDGVLLKGLFNKFCAIIFCDLKIKRNIIPGIYTYIIFYLNI